MSILSNYSDEEFKNIVANSNSIRDCITNLGYKTVSGSISPLVKERIQSLNINIDHFYTKKSIKRTPENIFIQNSTASQKVLREWYKKGNYTDYICDICGQIPEWNNKPLTLILDHINGDRTDDRLENLHWVCPNCNQQLETTGSRNWKHYSERIRPKVEKFYCIDCGAEISQGAIRCLQCHNKQKITKSHIIDREQLKQLIRTTPFVQIGKQFEVTDNTIRKWCIKLGLPSKSSEIKSYTDEEWEKI